jgi:transglutaminase-like putative cysteine protease
MNYRVSHVTTYSYEELASVCHNELRLTPRVGARQRPRRTQLRVDPTPSALVAELDFFGNQVHLLTLQEPHRRLVITAKSDVEVTPPAPPGATPPWEAVRERLRHDRGAEALDAYQFAFESPRVAFDDDVLAYAASSFPPGREGLAGVCDLTRRIHADFAYDQGATTVATPVADVLRERRGVCQDFAHLEIACLRALGLSARYVSGYILTTPPPGAPRLVGADASHAWVSVWLGDAGWVDVDPTNDQLPSDQHITVGWGRDYADVSPLRGVVLGGGEHQVTVAVDVTPLG